MDRELWRALFASPTKLAIVCVGLGARTGSLPRVRECQELSRRVSLVVIIGGPRRDHIYRRGEREKKKRKKNRARSCTFSNNLIKRSGLVTRQQKQDDRYRP